MKVMGEKTKLSVNRTNAADQCRLAIVVWLKVAALDESLFVEYD